MARRNFTSAEQIAMWRFLIEDHDGYGRCNMWELFIEETKSQRSANSLYHRFAQNLLPHLPQTKFHVETKLKLCQNFNVKVDEEFLKELETDAEVDLNEDGMVTGYQLKAHCPKNRDLEMDDEEFLGATSPKPLHIPFTAEEKTEIWKYFLENDMPYTPGSRTFWKGLIGKLKNRTVHTLRSRFGKRMAPKIHLTNFSIETKLKLYKKSQMAVDKKFLKTLRKHAELEIDENRCIVDYKIKTDRPEKRKNDNEEDENAKKARKDVRETTNDQEENEVLSLDDVAPGSSSEVQQEDEDLILDNVVDRGWTNPDMVIRRPPNIEVDDDDQPTFHKLFNSPVETKENEGSIMDLVESKSEMERTKFTSAEQMAMWRFVIADHDDYGKMNLWELFIEQTKSQRSAISFYYRFSRNLLPHLPQTKFHVETKLKLCQKYNVQVDEEFLKELETDAEVDLNEDGMVTGYQLKPHCPKNRDFEMDDDEFMETMSSFPSYSQWTNEEENKIWNYFLENDMPYTPGSNSFWKGLIGKFRNRTIQGLRMKFWKQMAPKIHLADFSIATKLKLYKKCQTVVNNKFLKTLREHAELKMNRDGCIIYYEMKNTRPEKRKNDNKKGKNAKKARRDVPGTTDDQGEDEDLGFDDVVPGSLSEVQQEDEDLILDNVVDRGWTNPDMVIRRPPKIEIDDDEDEPTFNHLFDSRAETVQDEDSIMDLVEPKSEVFEQDPVVFEYNEPNFREVEQAQRRDNQSDSIAQMLDVMKRMEKIIEDQRKEFVCANEEAKKDREAAEKQVVELSRDVVALKEEMSVLQKEVNIMRKEIKNALPEDPTASEKMKYLLILKKLVATRKPSPETEDFGKRIETALQSLPENDKSSLPMKAVNGILELAISAIGF